MSKRIFFAASPTGIVRAVEQADGTWQVERVYSGGHVPCLAVDPLNPARVFAGRGDSGVICSNDQGKTWQAAGLQGTPVRSLVASSHAPGTLYAGCKPVSLYVSHDSGATWQELPGLRKRRRFWWFSPAEAPDLRPYVQALVLSPNDPSLMLAGIELGGVLRSTDGGATWSPHQRGAVLDCHSLCFHPNENWVYEGGGSGVGAACSQDGGNTWQQPRRGLGKVYGWAVAADPGQTATWYLSASPQPNMFRGDFIPPAHMDGRARGGIYRCNATGEWVRLSGGLPQPLDTMAYALVTDAQTPGRLYAGLSNGHIWQTDDHGDHWQRLPVDIGPIQRSLVFRQTE